MSDCDLGLGGALAVDIVEEGFVLVELFEGAADWRKVFSIMVIGGSVFAISLIGRNVLGTTPVGRNVPATH